MLLHSWFRAVQFLCSALMMSPTVSPLSPLAGFRLGAPFLITDPVTDSVTNPVTDPMDEISAEEVSFQTCMAALDQRTRNDVTSGELQELQNFQELQNLQELHELQNLQELHTLNALSESPINGLDSFQILLSPTAEPVLTARGIALYRNDYFDDRNNQDDDDPQIQSSNPSDRADLQSRDTTGRAITLIYAIDLSQGAQLDLAGAIAIDPAHTEAHPNAAYDTHRDPHVPPRSLEDHWQAIVEAHPDRAFAAINGQFFGSTPVRLAFPLKAQGDIISGGYAGAGEYDGEKRMLAIEGQTATIAPFPEIGQPDNPLFSSIPDLIVGLHPCADKGRDRAVGRTFVGIADRDGDGQTETILILAASHATQVEAIVTLRRFGAIATVMLDGGGSTQTIALGQTYLVSSDRNPRAIPHTIGLLSGVPLLETSEP